MSHAYTSIDFETANGSRASACAVGLVKVRDGKIIDERCWLVRPPAGHDEFAPFNVSIHGIRPEDVAQAPTWREVLPELFAFVDGDLLIAHNAAFDVSVLRSVVEAVGADGVDLEFLCTLEVARQVLSLPSYRLPRLVEHFGALLEDHHDALADARAVVDVVNGLVAATGAAGPRALAAATSVLVGRVGGSGSRRPVTT